MTPAGRAVALALVGAYVDIVGYVMLRGVFPNHLAGDLPIASAHPGRAVLPTTTSPSWTGIIPPTQRLTS